MKRIIILVLATLGFVMCDMGYNTVKIPDSVEVVIVKAYSKPRHQYQDEYERMLYPVVRISSPSGIGSGVVISNTETYILTAAHVVEDQSVVDIEFYDSTVITASVVITDTSKDLALLQPQINTDDTDKIYCASLARTDYTPYIFTPIYTVGCSLGLNPRPSQGIISVIGKDNWEVTSPVLPGNSGGPVYDARTYEVIGIAVWVKVCQGQLITTMAGIVPITEIYNFLNQIK